MASLTALLVAALAAGGGYWFGQRQPATSEAATPGSSPVAGKSKRQEREILYYRNPMGLPDTSPTPKKDPMGMDYVPVYRDESDPEPSGADHIQIGTEKIQKLGVRTETVSRRSLDKVLRAAGRIEPDERRTYAIAPKFEGYVQRLHANVTGQTIGKGQALFDVYSPELWSAQREYLIAAQGADTLRNAPGEAQDGMRELAAASLTRLRNWDIPDEQIKALVASGATRRTLTFRSPVTGVVTEKKAVQGLRFMPGETLYQVADLSSVWVIAEVFEQDIGLLGPGGRATVRIEAYPDKVFPGRLAYIYPTLNATTRTVPVRIELTNADGLLKPGMFARVELPTASRGAVLTVPTSAVIDSGMRQIVLVQRQGGRFEPRPVKVGARSEERVEILTGVVEGESVVIAANFLIDAESNLKAAIGGFGGAGKPAAGVGHRAEGRVEEIDSRSGSVTIAHAPVPGLNWPAMSMAFKLANSSLLTTLRPGATVAFEFVERGPGEWVITALTPAVQVDSAPHAGH